MSYAGILAKQLSGLPLGIDMRTSDSLFIQYYQNSNTKHGYHNDPAQQRAVEYLQQLSDELQNTTGQKRFFRNNRNTPKGLYLWGSVGRGKTYLLDLFSEFLPKGYVTRLHFHHFMARIHRELQQLSGHKNPLQLVVEKFSQECKVICFDEFYVSDIGDAMILARLIESFFAAGIVFVATSNTQPHSLYKNGLQRQRFEPAISLLQQHLTILHMDGDTDHRLRQLTYRNNYFVHSADSELDKIFISLSQTDNTLTSQPAKIMNREIPVRKRNQNCIWFDFHQLCEGPRSQLDYIELASRYEHVFVSDIPQLGGITQEWIKTRGVEDGNIGAGYESTRTGERTMQYARMDDAAKRFISLVDELYDRRVNLFVSAEQPLERLYSQGSLEFEFNRTRSRLTEMRSVEYQSQAPLRN